MPKPSSAADLVALRAAAEVVRSGDPLSPEACEHLALALEGEAALRETQPSGFYEVPLDDFAKAVIG